MRSTWLILGAALLAGALGLAAGGWWSTPVPGVARIGDAAPPITLPDLEGRLQQVVPGTGKPQLINYWASWCPPCLAELPLLDGFAAAQGPNGTQVTGIALDEPEAVRAFLTRLPVRYPNLIEKAAPRDSSFRLGNARSVLPFSVLIDADGRIARLRAGAFRDAEDLRTWATLD